MFSLAYVLISYINIFFFCIINKNLDHFVYENDVLLARSLYFLLLLIKNKIDRKR